MINFYKSLSSKIERLFIYIIKFVKFFVLSIFSLIYKENCIICGCALQNNGFSAQNNTCSKNVNLLCKTCAKTVEFLSGFPQGVYDGVEIYSATIYKTTMRQLIHKLKFNHKKDVCHVLAYFLFEYYKKIEAYKKECGKFLPSLENLVIVPVPTNKNNIKQRGYNNVFEIAKEFSNLLRAPFSKNLLLKIKDTKPQYKLGPKERVKNVSGCFNINLKEVEKFKGKTVLIIDDIYTTGATINEIIEFLKKNNIENIFCITLSKVV